MARPIAGMMTASQAERFWNYVNKTDGCWVWTRAVTSTGYGAFGVGPSGSSIFLTHRLAYYLSTGIDPLDKHVCHTCDNRPCCNPDHLFLGTDADNIGDAARKGRLNWKPGVRRVRSCKLTPDAIRDIRQRYAAGETLRELAAAYGVHKGTVWMITSRRTWPHID